MNTVKEGFTTKEKQSPKNNKATPNYVGVISVVAVAVVGVGLLLYFKKRKHQTGLVEV